MQPETNLAYLEPHLIRRRSRDLHRTSTCRQCSGRLCRRIRFRSTVGALREEKRVIGRLKQLKVRLLFLKTSSSKHRKKVQDRSGLIERMKPAPQISPAFPRLTRWYVFSRKMELKFAKLYLELSLSEAGGEHRWTEREGGDTAGRRQYGSTWSCEGGATHL